MARPPRPTRQMHVRSWTSVFTIIAGFVLGLVALIVGLGWLGVPAAVLVVGGALVAWRSGIMSDYRTGQL